SGKAPHLTNIQSKLGDPDEFSILPTKPLVMPKDMAALPQPTPGGNNLADPTPEADAVAALGGKAADVQPGAGIPSSDGTLVQDVSRYGVMPDIRQKLDAEDLKFRKTHRPRLLPWIFSSNLYFEVYQPMTLDAQASLLRWRKAGVETPSAPPETKKK
ncbi:DUF3035 domain-containing protein, partial [Thioclava sp. BHET1]